MNDELQVGPNSICLICGQNIDPIEDSILDTKLEDGSKIYAHTKCTEALSNLLRQIGYQKDQPEQVEGMIRNIDGNLIITRRDFPNQFAPILLFFSIHSEAPIAIDKLKEWLDLNSLDFSNPSVPVGRLLKKGALAVIVGEDKVSRYFLTDSGKSELNEYLRKMEMTE